MHSLLPVDAGPPVHEVVQQGGHEHAQAHRVDQAQAVDVFTVQSVQPAGHEAAVAVADDAHPGDALKVKDVHHLAGHLIHGRDVGAAAAVAVAAVA